MLCLNVVMIWGSVVGGAMLLELVSSVSGQGVPPRSMYSMSSSSHVMAVWVFDGG